MQQVEERQRLIEHFVNGWVLCRTVPNTTVDKQALFTHVHFGENIGGRTDEFFVNNYSETSLNRIKQHVNTPTDYWLSVFSEQGAKPILGYKYKVSEFLMTHHLQKGLIPSTNHSPEIDVRAIKEEHETVELDKQIADPRRLRDPAIAYYAIYVNNEFAGNGRVSFQLDTGVSCLDNIYIHSTYRGQGLGHQLCAALLQKAAEKSDMCILASSQMGHSLYTKLGFETVCNIHVYEKIPLI
ncbi:GNAT family N-acetyltransferase [Paenibacillus sp. 481]|uniref:GNAT family N-acetyltransferase n=1 Tax=Paenibacillus sp. 481 TaxID=2835869 RepID=UPI001E4C0D0B|nr:GNAT family N-acetyltransferase [Paenibacillus sp. 481]UHA72745.1 GNAT family N-acetyltransferase [Paenibacillus sp. 481]